VRRLNFCVGLLAAIASTGCTHWTEFGGGGAAEDLPDTLVMNVDSDSYHASHELRQDFDYLQQHLDVLILRGAQRCFPAAVYTASLGENRVAREIAGGLLDDAEVSLLNLRIDLQQLEQKIDAVSNADSCWEQGAKARPESALPEGDSSSTTSVTRPPVMSEVDVVRLTALLNSDNQFAHGSSQINPKYQQNLALACVTLVQEPGIGLMVTGHTDASGDRNYNIALSSRRTKEVVDFLISCGIAAGRILLSFGGDSSPQYSGRSPAIDLVNRRVSIVLDVDNNRS